MKEWDPIQRRFEICQKNYAAADLRQKKTKKRVIPIQHFLLYNAPERTLKKDRKTERQEDRNPLDDPKKLRHSRGASSDLLDA